MAFAAKDQTERLSTSYQDERASRAATSEDRGALWVGRLVLLPLVGVAIGMVAVIYGAGALVGRTSRAIRSTFGVRV